MKLKIFIGILTIGFFITAFNSRQIQKNIATVDQKEGVYIFMFSKPIAEYQFLGTVKKTGLVWKGNPVEMFNILLRRCKKDYPQADGLIFFDVDMDRADCIKFK